MIAGVGVEEGEEVATGRGVDHLVDLRQGERILGAGLYSLVLIGLLTSRFQMKLNPEKCVFGVPAGQLLG